MMLLWIRGNVASRDFEANSVDADTATSLTLAAPTVRLDAQDVAEKALARATADCNSDRVAQCMLDLNAVGRADPDGNFADATQKLNDQLRDQLREQMAKVGPRPR